MSTSVPQVSWDNRPVIAKRRRAELYGFLNHLKIPYPVGAPKEQMLDLLKANNVDLNAPHDYFEWSVSHSKDEYGNMHQHVDPVTVPHESARLAAEGKPINYEKLIADAAAESEARLAEKDEQLEAQDTALDALMARLERLEANALPLENMSPPQLKGIAKRRGLDYKGLTTKEELIALLEG